MEHLQELLQRAKSMFIRYGVKSITMDDLASGMGMSKKTLYEMVPSKACLIEKMVHLHIKEEKKALAQIQLQSSNAVEEMIGIAKYVLQLLRIVSPNTIFEIKKYYWESWIKLERLNNEHIFQVIQENLKMGISQGYYRKEISADIIARLYVHMGSAIVNPEVFPYVHAQTDKIFKETIWYHLRGVTTPAGWELCEKYLDQLEKNEIQ